MKTYELPRNRVVVGGFSGGGTDAVRYAEFCAAGRSAAGVRVRGVFAVDAPLDLARLWRGETLAIARGAHAGFVAEAKMVLTQLADVMGGSPEQHPARYLEVSPVSAFAKGGGQAGLLRNVAVRLYTEPDVDWWMANRQVDYYSMNALDAAAVITQLQPGILRRCPCREGTKDQCGTGKTPEQTKPPRSDAPTPTGQILQHAYSSVMIRS